MSTGSNSHILPSPRRQKPKEAPKLDVKTILSIIPKINVKKAPALARSISPPLSDNQRLSDPNNHTRQR